MISQKALRKLSVFTVFITMSLAVVLPSLAQAQSDREPISIAVVNIQALLNDSRAAKSIQEQVDRYRKEFQEDFRDKESELKEREEDLAKERETLSEEAFREKVGAFQRRIVESQNELQDRRRELDEAVSEALGELREEILKIVAEMADENKYDLVLSRQNVVIVERSIDISKEVMDRLNKSVKKITVTVK